MFNKVMIEYSSMLKNIARILLLSTFLFVMSSLPVTATECVVSSSSASSTTASSSVFLTPTQIEAKVRTEFADIPAMIEIARCESGFRQFTDAGNVFYGGAGGGMIGVFQFYEKVHTKSATALGFRLATVEGNLGYARHLYEQLGTVPWQSCVKDVIVPVPSPDANLQKRLAIMRQLIGLLQQLLALKLAEK